MVFKKISLAAVLTYQLVASPVATKASEQEKFYPAPDMSGYELNFRGYLNEDREKGTLIEIYQDSKGNHIDKYVTNGIVWAYSVISDPKDLKKDYTIISEKCDGLFNKKINPYAEGTFRVPDCPK
jgi:hypothetical protein